jgi:hypothetical protein
MEDQQDKNQVKSDTRPGLAERSKLKLKVDITPQMIEDLLQSEPESEEYIEHPDDLDTKIGINDQLAAEQGISNPLVSNQRVTVGQSHPMDLTANGNRTDHAIDRTNQKDKIDKEQASNKVNLWLNRMPSPPVGVLMGPNITLRLMSIMTLLSNSVTIQEVLHIPAELHNPWHEIIIGIKKRQKANIPLIPWEYDLIQEHIGFLHTESMVQLARFFNSRTHTSMYTSVEVAPVFPHLRLHANYCPQCDVPHAYMPGTCSSIRLNGPRIMDHLRLDNSWRHYVQVAVVGSSELYYLPSNLKDSHLNLGDLSRPHYSVPTSIDQVNLITTSAGSLMSRLAYVISVVGAKSNIPIYLEFYPNRGDEKKAIHWHIMGFLNVIRRAQAMHNGPMVVLMGPLTPKPGIGQQEYWSLKTNHCTAQFLGFLIGLAMGVPVAMLPLQQLMSTQNQNEIIRYDHWVDEPIFSPSGVKTREFYRRFEFCLNKITDFLRKTENKCRQDHVDQSG